MSHFIHDSPGRRAFLKTGLAAALAPGASTADPPAPSPRDFAFYVISDTHYLAPADSPESLDEHILGVNHRLIDTLNRLPGSPLPDRMGGGTVTEPRGVLHLGDMIDSGDKGSGDLSQRRIHTEWSAYVRDFGLLGNDGRLRFPIYEIHGNHDSVREENQVIESLVERNQGRPGVRHRSANGLHYSWDWEGVHFIALGIVVGHNDDGLPTGRYLARDSLAFLREDLAARVGESGRPVVLLHHIDLLRYSRPCGPDSESGGEWSACDVAAYHQALGGFNIAAIFHGHLHGLRTDHWDGGARSVEAGHGIPVFGVSNAGAGGSSRGFFHVSAVGPELWIREITSRGTPDGWSEDSIAWTREWKVPLRGRES